MHNFPLPFFHRNSANFFRLGDIKVVIPDLEGVEDEKGYDS